MTLIANVIFFSDANRCLYFVSIHKYKSHKMSIFAILTGSSLQRTKEKNDHVVVKFIGHFSVLLKCVFSVCVQSLFTLTERTFSLLICIFH